MLSFKADFPTKETTGEAFAIEKLNKTTKAMRRMVNGFTECRFLIFYRPALNVNSVPNFDFVLINFSKFSLMNMSVQNPFFTIFFVLIFKLFLIRRCQPS